MSDTPKARQWKSSVRYLSYLIRCFCGQVPYNRGIIDEHYAQYERSNGKLHNGRRRKERRAEKAACEGNV